MVKASSSFVFTLSIISFSLQTTGHVIITFPSLVGKMTNFRNPSYPEATRMAKAVLMSWTWQKTLSYALLCHRQPERFGPPPELTLKPMPPFLQHRQANMRKMKVKSPEKETATTTREEDQESSLKGVPSVGR